MNIRIPFLDLKRQNKEIEQEIQDSIRSVLQKGNFILGEEVEAFENEWAEYCGVSAAAGVSNGTDALELALTASGSVRRGKKDEVITSPLTAGYTALAIVNAGGVPVFADIDPQTLTLNPNTLEKAITPRTRAIIPVHLYGRMCDMQAINEIASQRNLIVIEDAAQAQGAILAGKRAGSLGDVAAFSFYPTKNLGGIGDGGAVVSNNSELIDRIKTLRQGGHAAAMQSDKAGLNSRLDEVQAAVLRIKLRRLNEWNERRRQFATLYNQLLSDTSLKTFSVPINSESHVFHLYVVREEKRETLRQYLLSCGIETLIHYPFLLHRQFLFRRTEQISLPVAESVSKEIFSLPLYPQISLQEIHEIARTILEFGDNINSSVFLPRKSLKARPVT
jgi:dTDP-4-amino-4,6-dideoxygalactose transaminase